MKARNSSRFFAAILIAALGLAADGFIRAHFRNSIQSDETAHAWGSEQARAVFSPVPTRKPRVLIAAASDFVDVAV